MYKKGNMGFSGSLFFKVFFGVIATVGFVLLFLVWTLQSGATKTTSSMRQTVQPTGSLKHEEVIGKEKEKLVYNPELDLNYMLSKRKVPNGPDPIHNRRAGNSRRPPGRA